MVGRLLEQRLTLYVDMRRPIAFDMGDLSLTTCMEGRIILIAVPCCRGIEIMEAVWERR